MPDTMTAEIATVRGLLDETISPIDDVVARTIRERCTTNDPEGNGSTLDEVMRALLVSLGMEKSLQAFDAVHCWRS